MTNLIAPPSFQSSLKVQITGAHRGGEGALPSLERFARSSIRPVEVVAVDPFPGRARAYADTARKRGITVKPVEARYEDVRASAEIAPPDMNIVHVDDAGTFATAIEEADATGSALTGLLIAQLPEVGVVALRVNRARGRASASGTVLLRGMATVTSTAGSERFWGPKASVATRRREPALREWFNAGFDANAGRLLGGLAPRDAAPIEATTDGRTTRPVVVLDSDAFDDDPNALAARVMENALAPLERDQSALVVEVARNPEPALRFRLARKRGDHLLQIGSPRDVSRADVERQVALELAEQRAMALDAERERARAERDGRAAAAGFALGFVAGIALVGAIAGTATRREPIHLTD